MYCTKKITEDLIWVGASDRRLAMFEGVYSVPGGVSYNSYLLLDDLTVLFDTVDSAVEKVFLENIEHTLDGRSLDYVVVQHMEPDHSASLAAVLAKYPDATVVCNDKIAKMIDRFFGVDITERAYIVKEGDYLATGHHELTFVMAPMVHWPEVMMTFDKATGTLYSADAFGSFGALNGAIFADEIDYNGRYMDEARRYYCNIVGKYGPQVQALFKKAAALDIRMLCPLHGYVWRKDLSAIFDKYLSWSSYTPEETGAMIAYASIYGNTENAADILAAELCDRGIKVAMYDVSVTPASEIIAAAFRYSHLVFASATYNAGIFVTMDELLRDLAAHNIQNRTVTLMENGSWAPSAAKQMREILSGCKNMTILEDAISIPSAVKNGTREQIVALADQLASTAKVSVPAAAAQPTGQTDPAAFFKLSYGLFVLSAKEGEKDNGCIINTAELVTDQPKRIMIAVNKQNYTHDMIANTGVFTLSVLSESVPFDTFKRFGFCCGRDTDKFAGLEAVTRGENGLLYLTENTTAMIACKVVERVQYETHTVFFGEVTEAKALSDEPSVTYAYYHAHIKPKPAAKSEQKKGYVCKICGYVYEGDELPADFICPLCKHGAEDFEKIV